MLGKNPERRRRVELQVPVKDRVRDSKENDEPQGEAIANKNNNNNKVLQRTGSMVMSMATETQEPFMGVKVRRRTSLYRQYQGDYIDAKSNQIILKLLEKQGDRQVLFADNIVKVNSEGKIKRQVLLISDIAVYILDAQWGNLKHRIGLKAIEKVCLSTLSDNFFAIVVPTEYDTLLASTRKTEIVTVLGEAMKKLRDNPLEVIFSNRFEYYVGSDSVREVFFEEAEGGVKTRIVQKTN
uniref:TSA: Wollemia nobilis Ref_Wollemi_Transcript_5838_1238 transcribed RNA sequence n=1 Tax=Wollemia nobilis TaxID=56998 RepID=A0A0C9S851_9CONI